MTATMLMRQIRILTSNPTSEIRTPRFSSSTISKLRLFSSKPDAVVASAAVDVVDDVEDLIVPTAVMKTMMESNLLQPRVVVYDGVCHLCHSGVKWVIKEDKDRMIKFCCVQSKAALPYLRASELDREDVLRRFLFIEDYGLYHQGSTAALRVLAYLPLPYSALSSLVSIPTPIRDAVYDHVAKRRYHWFGKDEDCLVLKEQDLLARFIDRDEILERSRSKFN